MVELGRHLPCVLELLNVLILLESLVPGPDIRSEDEGKTVNALGRDAAKRLWVLVFSDTGARGESKGPKVTKTLSQQQHFLLLTVSPSHFLQF